MVSLGQYAWLLRLWRRLDRFGELVNRLAIAIIAVLLSVMTAVVLLQVFRRYILNSALIWPEELSLMVMTWITFAGVSVGVRRGDHVAVEYFRSKLPARAAQFVSLLWHTVMIAMMLVFTAVSWKVMFLTRDIRSDAMQVSLIWPKLALPVGGALAILQLLSLLVADFITILSGIPSTDLLRPDNAAAGGE